MSKRLAILSIVSVLIFISGCTSFKRYRSAEESASNIKLADADLFGFRLSDPAPAEQGRTLWDLSADAQSQFIKILNLRYPDNEMFLNSLSNEYLNNQHYIFTDNYTDRDLRLVFSVSKRRNYAGIDPVSGIKITPADRLEYIKLSLKLSDQSIRFKGWNMFSTEYGTIDIGDISFSRSLDLSLSDAFNMKKGDKSSTSSAGINSSLSRKEDQSVKYRYLKLNGRLNDSTIVMEEEGTRETDLIGNIIADVSIGFDTFPETLTRITGLKDSTGKYNDPSRLKIDYSLVFVPGMKEIKDTIYAVLEMDYVYRNVVSGSKTFPESDDRVRYYTGKAEKQIVLFTESDYLPDFYCLGSISGNSVKNVIKLKQTDNTLTELKFRSWSEASAFHEWLIYYFSKEENSGKLLRIGSGIVLYKDSNLTTSQISGQKGLKVLSYYN